MGAYYKSLLSGLFQQGIPKTYATPPRPLSGGHILANRKGRFPIDYSYRLKAEM
jgi:hypothetical protein